MGKQIFFFLILILWVGSCAQQTEELPVPLKKAAMIIVDTHVAEAALQNVYGARKDSLASVYYQQIYDIHGIDSTTYRELIRLIRNNPEYMETVYEVAFEEMRSRSDSPN